MLEIKVTGNVGTARLVTAAGKSPVLNVSLAANRKMGDREFTAELIDWPHELTPRCGGVAVPVVWQRACVHSEVIASGRGEW